MKTSRLNLIPAASAYGLSLADDTPHATTLIAFEAAKKRFVDGLASPEMVEQLLGLGYNPEIVLSLTWAHANEAIRLLTVDPVRTGEQP